MTQPDLSGLTDYLQDHGIGVVVLLILAFIAFRAVRPIVHRVLTRLLGAKGTDMELADISAAEADKRAATLEDLLSTVLRFTIILVTILVILTWLNLLPVIAGLGVIIAAITLAGQSIVLDYLMGILIVLEGPFYKGDWITVGTVEGTVEEVGLRRTTLRDNAGTFHSVSNGEIRIASNLTRVYARMQVDMIVAFGTDLDLATRVVNQVGQAMYDDPDWTDRLLEVPSLTRLPPMGDLGITLRVAGKVKATERWAAPSELRRRLLVAFQANGIEIPLRGQVTAVGPAAAAAARPGPSAGAGGDGPVPG